MKPRPAKHGKRVIIMCRVGGHSERGGHTGPTGPGPGAVKTSREDTEV